MTNAERTERDAYYEAAGSWATDRDDRLRASRRVAWIVAGCAGVIAVAEAIALVALIPLKTVVPYTLLVDRHTGYVQALAPLAADRIAPDTALTQSFIVQYVIARESFGADALQANYRKAVLWSAGTARAQYIAGMQAANPLSPIARLPRTSVIETQVKSVSPLGGNSALVRFDTRRRDAGGALQPAQPYVVVIRYQFSTDAMTREDRFVNPLGFQVTRYRRDAEALPQPDPAPPAAPAPTAAPESALRPASAIASTTPSGSPLSFPGHARMIADVSQ